MCPGFSKRRMLWGQRLLMVRPSISARKENIRTSICICFLISYFNCMFIELWGRRSIQCVQMNGGHNCSLSCAGSYLVFRQNVRMKDVEKHGQTKSMFAESINDNNSHIDRAHTMCRHHGERCACMISFSPRRSPMTWTLFLFPPDSGTHGGLGRFLNLRWSWNSNPSLPSHPGTGEGPGLAARGEAA